MFLKRQFPVYIMVTVGLLTLLGHFLKGGGIENFIQKDSLSWFNIIASFSILLGAFNLLKIHLQKFAKRQKDWQYSLIALLGFLIMIVGGFFFRGANYLSIKVDQENIDNLVSVPEPDSNIYFLNNGLLGDIEKYFEEELMSECIDSNGNKITDKTNSELCYNNDGQWVSKIIDPLEINRLTYDSNNKISVNRVPSEITWMLYDYLEREIKNKKLKQIFESEISIYDLKNILDENLVGSKSSLPITDECFKLYDSDEKKFEIIKKNGYCDIGPIEDLTLMLNIFPEWRFFENFKDNNNNNRIDEAEVFDDLNGNDVWDKGEDFIDIGNGIWDKGETFKDCGFYTNDQGKEDLICVGEDGWKPEYGNGIYDKAEDFIDIGNRTWDPGEEFADANNNLKYDEGEIFIDIGNGIWDQGESFVDDNENGKYDKGEEFQDKSNGKWDKSERFLPKSSPFLLKAYLKTVSFKNYYNDLYEKSKKSPSIYKDFSRKSFSFNNLNSKVKEFDASIVSNFMLVKSVDWGKHVTESGTFFKWLFDSAYSPIDMTMFALLAFFVASASYRAFRIRNFEASLLLFAGVLVMIGAVPFGLLIPDWFFAFLFLFTIFAFLAPLFKDKKQFYIVLASSAFFLLALVLILDFSFLNAKSIMAWIIAYPTVAGKKAIMIGIALGIVATSLRIIFGRDKSFLGD